MGRSTSFRLDWRARQTLAALDALLAARYGTPEAELDNKSDPLEEAVYIILSFQTDLDRCHRVWAHLRSAFPSWSALARAPVRYVARVLRDGGLQTQKSKTIKALLRAVRDRTGGFSLDALRRMNGADAERFLTGLPGLSWKGARCVLLYSLDHAVLPVDGNTFRILKRVGILPAGTVYRRRSLHDALQAAVPPKRRRALHVNLVVHGQRTCRPRQPQCPACAAKSVCAMRGVPRRIRALARHAEHEKPPRNGVSWKLRA